jgi:hypothetical protein
MEKFTWQILHLVGIQPQWEVNLIQRDTKLQKFFQASKTGLYGCSKKWDELYINRLKFIKGWK